VHCCLYFLQPTGERWVSLPKPRKSRTNQFSLKAIDILVIRALSEYVNVVPVIAKADSLTLEERARFKQIIRDEFAFHHLKLYPYDTSDLDETERTLNSQIRKILPFAVCGSEKLVNVDGRQVRARVNRWGVVMIENEAHCEFVYLRNFLMRTHLQDLIERTSQFHYEAFRTKQLMALKETGPSMSNSYGSSRPLTPSVPSRGHMSPDLSQRNMVKGY